MKLYYYKSPEGNFGDNLNPWIWPKLLPGKFDGECFHSYNQKLQNENADSLFLGIGTLLNTNVPMRPTKTVFGTGFGYGQVASIDDKWKFYCVRGPLSAKALELEPEMAVTDSAVLLRVVELPKVSKIQYKFSFMPHYQSQRLNKRMLIESCKALGINYIDPTIDIEAVFVDILSSETLITEAMHGAIVADALRIPWIPVKTNDFILEFKWQDWCQSLGLDYQPITIPYSFRKLRQKTKLIDKGRNLVNKFCNTVLIKPFFIESLKNILQNGHSSLSSDHAIEIATSRLLEKFDKFKADCAVGGHR